MLYCAKCTEYRNAATRYSWQVQYLINHMTNQMSITQPIYAAIRLAPPGICGLLAPIPMLPGPDVWAVGNVTWRFCMCAISYIYSDVAITVHRMLCSHRIYQTIREHFIFTTCTAIAYQGGMFSVVSVTLCLGVAVRQHNSWIICCHHGIFTGARYGQSLHKFKNGCILIQCGTFVVICSSVLTEFKMKCATLNLQFSSNILN